jgi:hypothetical protein
MLLLSRVSVNWTIGKFSTKKECRNYTKYREEALEVKEYWRF